MVNFRKVQKTLHYLPYDELSGTGSGKVLKYTYPFISYNNNYGYVPDYDDLNGGYIQTYDTEKGIYQNPPILRISIRQSAGWRSLSGANSFCITAGGYCTGR